MVAEFPDTLKSCTITIKKLLHTLLVVVATLKESRLGTLLTMPRLAEIAWSSAAAYMFCVAVATTRL